MEPWWGSQATPRRVYWEWQLAMPMEREKKPRIVDESNYGYSTHAGGCNVARPLSWPIAAPAKEGDGGPRCCFALEFIGNCICVLLYEVDADRCCVGMPPTSTFGQHARR